MNQKSKASFSKVVLPPMPWYPVSDPISGKLPLIAVGRLNDASGSFSKKYYNLVKDAGLNIVQNGLYSFGHIKQSFLNAKESGVKFFVRFGCPNVKVSDYSFNPPTAAAMEELSKCNPKASIWTETYDNWTSALSQLLDYREECLANGEMDPLDLIAGYMIVDEPNAGQMWALSKISHIIWDIFMRKGRLSKLPFVFGNLYPNISGGPSSSAESSALLRYSGGLNKATNYLDGYEVINSYEDYINLYSSLINPPLLSFDAYPFRQDVSDSKDSMTSFFKSLLSFEKIKKEKGLNFWSTILCCRVISTDGKRDHGIPTVGRMNFAAFVSLLYGAKGLTFWPFVLPDDNENEKYSDAPLTKSGDKTMIYSYLQSVIPQIHRVEEIFLSSTIALTAVTKTPPQTELKDLPGIMVWTSANNFGAFESLESDGLGFVVAHLYNSSYNYLAVVNMDADKAQTGKFKFREVALEIMETNNWVKLTQEEVTGGKEIRFNSGSIQIFRYPR